MSRASSRRVSQAAVLVCALGLITGRSTAQSIGVAKGRDVPAWLTDWSPLSSAADLARRLPSASAALPSLLLPAEKAGLFWTHGNPGALPWDLVDRYGQLAVAAASQDGDLRRPLDPAESSVRQYGGFAWQPLGSRGAVIGRVVFDGEVRDPSSVALSYEPYASSPFIVTDTTSSAMRQTRARLEGAAGWRLGGWGLGASLGYDTRSTNTVNAPLARFLRQVNPAVKLGVVRSFGGGRLQLGVHALQREREQTVSLIEVFQEGQVYALQGYRDVLAHEFPVTYYRRISEEVRAVGAGAGGRVGPVTWSVQGERVRLNERSSSVRQDNPPSDEWKTSGSAGGAVVQVPMAGRRALLTLKARLASMSGSAEQTLPAQTGFNSEERVAEGAVELRLLPGASRWSGLITGSLLAERRERNDSIAPVRTIVDGTTTGVGLELARAIGDRFSAMAGYSVAFYSASGQIPSAASRGPVYQRVFAPELDMMTSSMRTQAVSLAARVRARASSSFWLAVRRESLSPSGEVSAAFTGATRSATGVWLGVTLAPPLRQ